VELTQNKSINDIILPTLKKNHNKKRNREPKQTASHVVFPDSTLQIKKTPTETLEDKLKKVKSSTGTI
jgi:hypothetical protein